MAAISQMIFTVAFSWMKSLIFWLKSQWSLLIMSWRQVGNKPLSEPVLTQFTEAYMERYGRWFNRLICIFSMSSKHKMGAGISFTKTVSFIIQVKWIFILPHPNFDEFIIENICTWHDDCAALSWAITCSDLTISEYISTKQFCCQFFLSNLIYLLK